MYKKFEFYFENLEIEKLRIEKNENLKKNKINGQKLIKIKYWEFEQQKTIPNIFTQ